MVVSAPKENKAGKEDREKRQRFYSYIVKSKYALSIKKY